MRPRHPDLIRKTVDAGFNDRIKPSPAIPPQAATPTPPAPALRRAGRSPLADILPTFETLAGWFRAIEVDAPSIPTGNFAWFGLSRTIIHATNDQEIWLAGITAELMPPDVDGAAGGSALAWGESTGLGAALVVGANLPIQLGQWTASPATVAGLGDSAINTVGTQCRPLWSTTFPTGKMTDSTPNKWHIAKNFAPLVYRFAAGSSLDIALVVNRVPIDGETGTIYGYASVQANVGQTEPRSNWTQ